MDSKELHVYEVVGKLVLRPSGRHSKPIECYRVKTRARLLTVDSNGHAIVGISTFVSGYEPLRIATWFSDWSPQDDMTSDCQAGREIEIAVPVQAYEYMLKTGAQYNRSSRYTVLASFTATQDVVSDVAAVLIDGRWEIPELADQQSLMANIGRTAIQSSVK